MSFRDGEMQGIALGSTVFVVAALVAPVMIWRGGSATADNGPNLTEMEAIEATLAYKKPNTPKQPQKQFQPPPPDEKVEGMSHDDQKKPDDKKPDDKKPTSKTTDPNPDDYKKYLRTDSEAPIGKPTDEDVGAFDGSEFGFAEVSKGDPYFQKLVGDLLAGWEYPEILADAGVPVGCLHIDAAGKIVDTKFKEKSGSSELDDSVERALTAVKKARNETPAPVPTHLLKQATTQWVCFKFKVKK
ncbi:MAG TPA: TonB C-terminal domain-containing protein [Kofleriaceae bacterium]|nr:TonB C-terminal domain-containing protein [Kofleriaceae bacterium]